MEEITENNPKIEQESDTPQRESDTNRPVRKKKMTKKEKKEAMIEVLSNQLGIVMIACRQVGISRETHYKWVKEDPKYAKDVNDTKFDVKDFGEHLLLKQMKEGNGALIWNFNKTRNRDRGYGEKVELEHTGNTQIIMFQEIIKSNEEIKEMKHGKTNSSEPKAE